MINAFSIAIGLLLILLSLITPLLNPFFRKVRKSDIKDSDDGYTGTESDISVLLLAYDEPHDILGRFIYKYFIRSITRFRYS